MVNLKFGVKILLLEGATVEGNHSFGVVTLPLFFHNPGNILSLQSFPHAYFYSHVLYQKSPMLNSDMFLSQTQFLITQNYQASFYILQNICTIIHAWVFNPQVLWFSSSLGFPCLLGLFLLCLYLRSSPPSLKFGLPVTSLPHWNCLPWASPLTNALTETPSLRYHETTISTRSNT